MMDQRRVESLKRRYGNHVSASQPAMGARGHGHRHGAQRLAGKPQNTKATVKRLMSYLEQYKLGILRLRPIQARPLGLSVQQEAEKPVWYS